MTDNKPASYALQTGSLETGGQRSRPQPFECGPGCEDSGTFHIWRDHARFIPLDDGSNGRVPTGVCQLVSTQIEILRCSPRGRIPPPDTPCSDVIREVATLQIADTGSDELTCRISLFKPFHRTGIEADKDYVSGAKFEPSGTPPAIGWNLAAGFVDNFDLKNMRIEGLPGIILETGWARGTLPVVKVITDYNVVVAAWNAEGEDGVAFKVSVHPT